MIAGCIKQADKVVQGSAEEIQQPFKDTMDMFFQKGRYYCVLALHIRRLRENSHL